MGFYSMGEESEDCLSNVNILTMYTSDFGASKMWATEMND